MLAQVIELDTSLFLFLNGLNSPFWDPIMLAFSGNVVWIPLYLFLVYLMIKKHGLKGLLLLVGVAVVVTMGDQLSVHLFKNVFERLRPCHNPEIQDLVHLVNGRCGGKFGFVSSHAANTFGVATFLVVWFKHKWLTISLLLWAAVVSYSRIYLGVHYPADILCGALLGAACGLTVWWGFGLIGKRFSFVNFQ
jgi:undecaprenyl-diphosphatase